MEIDQALTLVKNYPDVFLALLKRMPEAERVKLLKQLEFEHPKDYKVWYSADVKAYLTILNRQI